jgi:hypothetical protein
MPNVSEEILIDALEIRDTHEHLSAEIAVGNAGYGDISVFVESTLNKPDVAIEVYVRRTDGEWCNIPFGNMTIANGVNQVQMYSGPFPWLRVGVTAETAPTTGNITIAVALKPA